jgi:hypothetical protein
MFSAGGANPTAADEALVRDSLVPVDNGSAVTLGSDAALPVMSPELALASYLHRTEQQTSSLAAYSAVTVIHAELPDTSQQGEFELQRKFEAPHTLQFTPLHFSGDGFVKSNVITRLLQSEVDHVQKDDPSQTAISPVNYKFSYKGASRVQDRLVHVYQVKPHKKHPGLFKGRVYLDAHTGALVRVEGNVVKSNTSSLCRNTLTCSRSRCRCMCTRKRRRELWGARLWTSCIAITSRFRRPARRQLRDKCLPCEGRVPDVGSQVLGARVMGFRLRAVRGTSASRSLPCPA